MKETYSIPIYMSYILDLYIGPIYSLYIQDLDIDLIYSRPAYRNS